LSPLTLGHLMEELFAVELNAWQLAQRRGTSLAQHVTDTHSLEAAAAATGTPAVVTTPSARTQLAAAETVQLPGGDEAEAVPLHRSRKVMVTAALLAVGIVAFAVTVWPTRARIEAPLATAAPA